MQSRYWKPALTIAAAMSLSVSALAGSDNGRHHDNENGRSRILKVALWGDEFYNTDETVKSEMVDQTIDSMNSHQLSFSIFVGDTKNGSSQCSDAAILDDPRTIFERLRAPTLYSLGDNEWTDCHRTNNGSYDPIERLTALRVEFFGDNRSQGRHPIRLERQGAYSQEFSENSRFVKSDVEFVALHIPGSNNNLVVTDSQCTNKSDRTQADCDAASLEYLARNIANLEWLRTSFDEARTRELAGIVIAIQADVYFPFELSDGIYQDEFLPLLDENNGYSDFFKALVAETQSFEGQVLLVHGDSHYFKMDKAMFNEDGRVTSNFTRVEVFGSAENSWVEMTVDPDAENVFSFQPVILQ